MSLKQYQIDRINDSRYCILLKSVPCKECGSMLQACVFSDKENGEAMAQSMCLRCGHTRLLPKYSYMEENANRLDKWSNIVRNRDDRRCHICGSYNQIEAHHIIPKDHDPTGEWWYMPSNGIALCRRCHELVHGEWMTKYRKERKQECSTSQEALSSEPKK